MELFHLHFFRKEHIRWLYLLQLRILLQYPELQALQDKEDSLVSYFALDIVHQVQVPVQLSVALKVGLL